MRARQPHEPPLAPAELKQYQRLLGITRYIADTVGYEIALAASELASHVVDPCERHEKALKRLIRYIGGRRDMSVTYIRQNGLASQPHIEAWVDSDWAKCTDTRRSRTGIAITFAASCRGLCRRPARRLNTLPHLRLLGTSSGYVNWHLSRTSPCDPRGRQCSTWQTSMTTTQMRLFYVPTIKGPARWPMPTFLPAAASTLT
jgi:hypothetical protein